MAGKSIYKNPDQNALARMKMPREEWKSIQVFDKRPILEYIVRRRKELEISAYTMAGLTGIDRQYISGMLSGKHPCSMNLMGQMLWLLDGDDCPYQLKEGEVKSEPKAERLNKMSVEQFCTKHPDVQLNEFLPEEWEITLPNELPRRYAKMDYSLTEVLATIDAEMK